VRTKRRNEELKRNKSVHKKKQKGKDKKKPNAGHRRRKLEKEPLMLNLLNEELLKRHNEEKRKLEGWLMNKGALLRNKLRLKEPDSMNKEDKPKRSSVIRKRPFNEPKQKELPEWRRCISKFNNNVKCK